jgi:hypothetical protein
MPSHQHDTLHDFAVILKPRRDICLLRLDDEIDKPRSAAGQRSDHAEDLGVKSAKVARARKID